MPDAPTLTDLTASDELFAVHAVDGLLRLLVDRDGSDLHLRPANDGLHAAVRVAGVLNEEAVFPVGGERIVARLKVLASLLTYETDRPQDGRLRADAVEGFDLDARLATCPTVFGEKAVVRRFASGGAYETLADVALPEPAGAAWEAGLSQPSGLLLVTGPAGAGKTTTAYAGVRSFVGDGRPPRSVVSLEDPVERTIEGVAQTAVGGHTPLTFADGLRAVLRHDPEVIFVGELRDRDTIATALTAALTGHLVISTLHTGSAGEAVTRLLDADVEPFLVLSGLKTVLHQRLVRTADGGRRVIAEHLSLDDRAVREAVRDRTELPTPADDVRSQAARLRDEGTISDAELVRLFGTAG